MLEKLLGGHKVEVSSSGRKMFNMRELMFTWWTTFRSGLMGFFIGVLPGAGASVASAVAYANEKRLNEGKDPNACFGRGDLRGLAAPEAANNAAATGSFIPMLTLGVPGSGTTAVMMGALTLYNITPGPVLFENQPALVWGLIASLMIANVILLIMNIPMVRVFAAMLAIPGYVLVPGILAISFIGVYAISGSVFDLLMMTAIGVIGYFMTKVNMPMAPLVLGVVLGNLMEQNLRRGLSITNGDPAIFFSSGICVTLWILAIAVVSVPPAMRAIGRRRRAGTSSRVAG
jgi:putative tricarboxylic transport membrane protein